MLQLLVFIVVGVRPSVNDGGRRSSAASVFAWLVLSSPEFPPLPVYFFSIALAISAHLIWHVLAISAHLIWHVCGVVMSPIASLWRA